MFIFYKVPSGKDFFALLLSTHPHPSPSLVQWNSQFGSNVSSELSWMFLKNKITLLSAL